MRVCSRYPGRSGRAVAAVLMAALALAACSDDGGEATGDQPSVTTSAPPDTTSGVPLVTVTGPGLPPADLAGLEELFGERYEALGLRLTRGAVIPLRTGPHLQIYVEPTGPATSEDVLELFMPVARAVLPAVFDEYPTLSTFDVCIEPPPGVDDRLVPDPLTVLFIGREQNAAIDWDGAELIDVRSVLAAAPQGFGEVRVHPSIESLPAWAASTPPGETTTSTSS